MQRDFFRHELKYFINYFEYQILKSKLVHFMDRDSHSDNSGHYHIRSLYFDDYQNSCLFEKQSGIHSRKKYRIRIYNKKNNLIKLECKSRVGDFIRKQSKKIDEDLYFKIIKNNFDDLILDKNELLNHFYVSLNSNLFRPKVIVDYFREAFIWQPNNVRITFDKNLKTGLNAINILEDLTTISIHENPIMIMEIKYDHFLPKFINQIISFNAHQRDAISKYVLCRKHTKENNWEDN